MSEWWVTWKTPGEVDDLEWGDAYPRENGVRSLTVDPMSWDIPGDERMCWCARVEAEDTTSAVAAATGMMPNVVCSDVAVTVCNVPWGGRS